MHIVDDQLLATILGRKAPMFAEAAHAAHNDLSQSIKGRRILVVGAAGSIGSAFVKQVIDFSPAAIHLMDLNENGLAELIRDLRSSSAIIPDDFKTFSIGLGSAECSAFAEHSFDYDTIVNFAALKHVRAERDPYSMLRMLNTNVVYLDDILTQITANTNVERVFSVSSDKSVSPASVMGSSKTLMEDVLWLHADRFVSTSARFANVAFSAGSLLESFLMRLNKGQPLAAPNDVRRFFISHQEAGLLCLIGAFLGTSRDVVFPGLNPQTDLMTFSEIAVSVLEHFGYEPQYCESDREAREIARSASQQNGSRWPVFFSASNTSGEKMYEEFHSAEENIIYDRWANIGVVHQPALGNSRTEKLRLGLDKLRKLRSEGNYDKAMLLKIVQSLTPELEHIETGISLDTKM